MKFKISCKDLGMSDDFFAIGDSKELIIRKMIKHLESFHNLKVNPKLMGIIESSIWRRNSPTQEIAISVESLY
jgi:predicted small metal-binding protein